MEQRTPLRPGHYYHVFNRGNNRENLFREERNYAYFLRLYAHHVQPHVETFAYCLMPNHFHLFIRVRDNTGARDASRAIGRLCNAYAQAFNRAYERTGSLFETRFGRIEVDGEGYAAVLVRYIHRNPQTHGFVADFRSYPHSSYPALVSRKPTRLARSEVLAWFGGASAFEETHGQSDAAAGAVVDAAFETAVHPEP